MKSTQALPKEIVNLAVEWLLEKQDGFAPGRAAKFQAWCDADPRHALAVTKAERTLSLLGALPTMKAALSALLGEEAEKSQPNSRRFWRRAAAWSAVAATVALAAVTVAKWGGLADKAHDVSYVSNADRPQQVVLADGSFVDLNSHTTIRTQMLPRERRIALQEGEAHFAVAHDASRPFVVEAAGVTMRAVGTAFNVRISEHRLEVLVSEGKVEITEARAGVPAAITRRQQLGVADRAVISRGSAAPTLVVEKVDQRELRDALSWHSSVTTISSRPLGDIVELFNRRNTLRLTIAHAELAERNFGGSFTLNQPRAFVRALEIDGDVLSETRGENEIVLRLKR
jgi:transmembrane sensor